MVDVPEAQQQQRERGRMIALGRCTDSGKCCTLLAVWFDLVDPQRGWPEAVEVTYGLAPSSGAPTVPQSSAVTPTSETMVSW